MSFIKGVKGLVSHTVRITCPHCSQLSEQSSSKVRKDRSLLCPHCKALFLPSECEHLG
ncbi:YnfU family zinc-binding protein [Serratia fonticola]|uniref:YnfU family zinc-binding protein n=1 Tax=Serratia fonticola TaxID=47917 RepID=UPI001F1B0B7A|nr:YnfU family zinc-binding protein [Serratia fonticola]